MRSVGADTLMRRASRAQGAEAAQLYLQAAQAFRLADDPDGMDQALSQIDTAALPAPLHSFYYLLRSEVAFAHNDWLAAQSALTRATNTLQRGDPHTAELYAHIASLCMQRNDPICAANALIDQSLAGEAQLTSAHNDQIWHLMDQVSGTILTSLAGESDRHAAWWQLKARLSSSFSIAEQRRRLAQWNADFPDHPLLNPPPQALDTLVALAWKPRQIALILPLQGVFANAGKSVRDGFISAYLYDTDPDKPTVRIYDSQAEPLPLLYERVLNDGCDMIVGPLTKTMVDAFNDLNPEIPVLALNYLDGNVAAANLKQLGLAIEDEAETVVDRLLQSNADSILVLHSEADWSRRAAEHVAAHWPYAIVTQGFKDLKTVTEAVGGAMLVDASQDRFDALQQLLGEDLEFLPRARKDLDAVVVFVSNIEANAVVPALKYHFADDLPVYASSQVAREARSEIGLDILGGFQICDMPFNLLDSPFKKELTQVFNLGADNLTPLYVLGVDAYSVSNQLMLLTSDQPRLLANTGELTMNDQGQFRRELVWGYISQGELRPVPVVVDQPIGL
ncbi:MAG: penicillin-binding protein activator [Proteobacteria bacterium]|nr:penicillin-binding protein activator [Pseudomonadota bacterium]